MTEETETNSISDDLRSAFAEVEADTESETTDDGISQEAVTQDEETTEVVAEEESQSEEVSDDVQEPEDQVFQAPEHWSSDDKEKFEALSPEARELVLERDTHFQQGFQEKAEGIAAISEALEPWKDALAQRGITADQAIRTLFAAQNQIDANPLQGILNVAQSYGILDQMKAHFAPQTDDDDFTDPEIKALRQEISDLKGHVTNTVNTEAQRTTDGITKIISDFKSATNDKGELLHPHFDEVKVLMGGLVQAGKTIDEAYEEAVWTQPKFRDSQTKNVVEETAEEKAARVRKAKKAARGVATNGKADPAEVEEAQTLHDTIAAAYSQHSA